MELKRKKTKVYNITVEKDHVYFANDILVSNCHSTVYFMAGVQKFSGATGGIIGGSNALKGVRTGPTIQPDQSVQFNPIKGMFKKNV